MQIKNNIRCSSQLSRCLIQDILSNKLSKLEIKTILILSSLTRDEQNYILVSKKFLKNTLACGKNTLSLIIKNLEKYNFIYGQNEIIFSSKTNNRYYCLKLNDKYINCNKKSFGNKGYINVTKLHIEEFLKIDDVNVLRLQLSALVKAFNLIGRDKRNSKKTIVKYTKNILSKVWAKYLCYMKIIEKKLEKITNMFEATITENFEIILTLNSSYNYNFCKNMLLDMFYEEYEECFHDDLKNLNYGKKRANEFNYQTHTIAIQNEILDTLAKARFAYSEETVKLVARSFFENFKNSKDVIKNPERYLNKSLKNLISAN